LPTGVLADTLGPRRVLAAGGLIAGIGSIMFGSADAPASAGVGRALVGLGVSVAFISLLKLNASWFEERRFGTATGFANVIGISGALAATAPLAWLVTLTSWRNVFLGIGILSLAVAALTWRLVRDLPGGASATITGLNNGWHRGLAEVVRNRATWPGFWVNFGIAGSYMSFVGLWAVPFLVEVYGYSPLAASRHTSIMLIAFAFSVAGVGVLSDRLQRRRPLIIASALMYLACWAVWLSGLATAESGITYLMCALMGFGVTGFTLSWACAKEVNRPSYSGMATSLANTGGFLAVGVLQPLVGWVLDRTANASVAHGLGGFRPALAVLAVFALIGLLGALFIRETRCRNIWKPEMEQEAK
jgi:MFS family permease